MDFDWGKLLGQQGQWKKRRTGQPKDIISIINIRGIIQDAEDAPRVFTSRNEQNFEKLRPLIEQAFDMPGVLAVILLINSPGGSPTQTNLIANFILQRRAQTKIPVYSVVEDIAASGGYWLACSGDEIHIDENSMVGSIGVISLNVGLAGLLRKFGVEPRVQVVGKHKAAQHPLADHDDAQEKLLRESMQCIQKNFKDFVKQRRPALAKVSKDSEVFSGRVFVGEYAVQNGLADSTLSMQDLLEKKFPGRDDLQLIEVKLKDKYSILNALTNMFQDSAQCLLVKFLERANELYHNPPSLQAIYNGPAIHF